jgi:hypothetical protein
MQQQIPVSSWHIPSSEPNQTRNISLLSVFLSPGAMSFLASFSHIQCLLTDIADLELWAVADKVWPPPRTSAHPAIKAADRKDPESPALGLPLACLVAYPDGAA